MRLVYFPRFSFFILLFFACLRKCFVICLPLIRGCLLRENSPRKWLWPQFAGEMLCKNISIFDKSRWKVSDTDARNTRTNWTTVLNYDETHFAHTLLLWKQSIDAIWWKQHHDCYRFYVFLNNIESVYNGKWWNFIENSLGYFVVVAVSVSIAFRQR